MNTVVYQWAVDKGIAELKSRGLDSYTYNIARDQYYQGFISQDDLDLFIDCWYARPCKFSVSDSQRNAAYNRLIKRYGG